jgi:hypothetical protein
MPLWWLSCWSTPVADLTPLKDMKLKYLYCGDTRITDLSALQGMPLVDLHCNPEAVERNAAVLRSIKTLEKINRKLAAEALKQASDKKP